MDDLYLRKEMEDILFDFETDKDNRIKSSIIIEAFKMKFDLNEEQEQTLSEKLDPNKTDKPYNFSDLFHVFKEWMSSNNYMPDHKSVSSVSITSTPLLSKPGPMRSFLKRKLFSISDSILAENFESFQFNPDDNELDAKFSSSSNSSSANRRLSFQNVKLETKLKTTERHASSLEKKYESATDLCEKQQLEIDRLKQELKEYREREQCMEETNEEMIKTQKETEAKYNADLILARSLISKLETEVSNLKRELTFEAGNKLKTDMELETSLNLRLEVLEATLLLKERTIAELLSTNNYLQQWKEDQIQAFEILNDHNMALTSELAELKKNIRVKNFDEGVPLCEELPSEMIFAGADDSDLSRSSNNPPLSRHFVKTPYCLTCTDDENLVDEELISKKTQTEMTNSNRILVTSECQTVNNFISVGSQTDTSKLHLLSLVSTHSQTNLILSSDCQTDLSMCSNPIIASSYSQTDIVNDINKIVESTYCQTEKMESTTNQTHLSLCSNPIIVSSFSQTDIVSGISKTVISTDCQTEKIESTKSQTDIVSGINKTVVSIDCQTKKMKSTKSQTDVVSGINKAVISTDCQTEKMKSTKSQTDVVSGINKTVISINCLTEKMKSSKTQTDLSMIHSPFTASSHSQTTQIESIYSQTDEPRGLNNNLITKSSQISLLESAKLQTDFSKSSNQFLSSLHIHQNQAKSFECSNYELDSANNQRLIDMETNLNCEPGINFDCNQCQTKSTESQTDLSRCINKKSVSINSKTGKVWSSESQITNPIYQRRHLTAFDGHYSQVIPNNSSNNKSSSLNEEKKMKKRNLFTTRFKIIIKSLLRQLSYIMNLSMAMVLIFMLFFWLYSILCQNNHCVPQLRYSRPPPV